MASVASAGEAVARIAYLSSDVILAVQPAPGSYHDFSDPLRSYAARRKPGLIAKDGPEVLTLRHNVDPLLSAFQPLRSGKLLSVTASSSVLLTSIPHLYKLAQYPIVLHIVVGSDFSDLTAVRQSGFIFLHSETIQEAQDVAISAHALAIKIGKGVIHFFDPANSAADDPISAEGRELLKALLDPDANLSNRRKQDESVALYVDEGRRAKITEASGEDGKFHGNSMTLVTGQSFENTSTKGASSIGSSVRGSSADSRPTVTSATSVGSLNTRLVTSDDILDTINAVWSQIKLATGRSYHAFEYSGPSDAQSALFLFGSTGLFVDELREAKPSDGFASLDSEKDYQVGSRVTRRLN
ncbi:MAG: hypothetical protein Q9214_004584 [Letrouitia sp. 1 TL-2023]